MLQNKERKAQDAFNSQPKLAILLNIYETWSNLRNVFGVSLPNFLLHMRRAFVLGAYSGEYIIWAIPTHLLLNLFKHNWTSFVGLRGKNVLDNVKGANTPFRVNESRYITWFVFSRSIKKLFSIDCVNVYLLSIIFSIDFSR